MDWVNTQIEEALKSLQSGNRQDAERALETLQGVVYGFGMKVCGSHEDAQDTAQETLIRLARQLREFPDARALSVWLYKVAKTQCLMSRRTSIDFIGAMAMIVQGVSGWFAFPVWKCDTTNSSRFP